MATLGMFDQQQPFLCHSKFTLWATHSWAKEYRAIKSHQVNIPKFFPVSQYCHKNSYNEITTILHLQLDGF